MKTLRFSGALALLSLGACAYGSLHQNYGTMYNDIFAAQQADRAAREPWGMRGTEAKRVVSAYYESLGPDEAGAGAVSGGGGGGSSRSSSSSSSSQQNPFSTKSSR